MGFHLGKFVHTKSGKILMSVLLGLGLASLFRKVCENKNCYHFSAPPLNEIDGKIYKSKKKCVKYVPAPTKCSLNVKTISFE
jgi:hypothetical protein